VPLDAEGVVEDTGNDVDAITAPSSGLRLTPRHERIVTDSLITNRRITQRKANRPWTDKNSTN
jgi:hypothetical protein